MTMRIEIEIKRADLTARMHNQLMREINRGVMERHVAERLPKHFTNKAHSEYGARQRSNVWNRTKRNRYKKPVRPNVGSGQMLASLRTKITATQYGSRLLIRVKQGEQLPADEWAKMSTAEKAKWSRRNVRRMANWQKREIAVMSKNEIIQERHRQALEYRLGALSSKYRRQRTRRIK